MGTGNVQGGARALGVQLLVELFEADPTLLDDVALVARALVDAALACGMTVLDSRFHHFSPQGVSGVVIVAESHLAIHTWPERGFAALDIFTCGAVVDPERGLALLRERFRAERLTVLSVHRGHEASLGPRPAFTPQAGADGAKKLPMPASLGAAPYGATQAPVLVTVSLRDAVGAER